VLKNKNCIIQTIRYVLFMDKISSYEEYDQYKQSQDFACLAFSKIFSFLIYISAIALLVIFGVSFLSVIFNPILVILSFFDIITLKNALIVGAASAYLAFFSIIIFGLIFKEYIDNLDDLKEYHTTLKKFKSIRKEIQKK